MQKIKDLIINILSQPCAVLGIMIIMSIISLASAYTAEYGVGLQPCILCLYQRIPFALAVLISGFGLIATRKGWMKDKKPAIITLAVNAGLMFANSAIAFYHTGVERHWWVSAIEGCKVPREFTPGNFMEAIIHAPAVPCDVIPWQDPILGLSIANINVGYSAGLGVFCVLAIYFIRRRT